jgi:hypothetical protein
MLQKLHANPLRSLQCVKINFTVRKDEINVPWKPEYKAAILIKRKSENIFFKFFMLFSSEGFKNKNEKLYY